MTDWISEGRPLRDPEDTKDLFETHCKGGDGPPCPSYVPWEGLTVIPPGFPDDAGSCAECGCFVSGDPTIVMNKVNKPHEACPLKKWARIVQVKGDHDETPTT